MATGSPLPACLSGRAFHCERADARVLTVNEEESKRILLPRASPTTASDTSRRGDPPRPGGKGTLCGEPKIDNRRLAAAANSTARSSPSAHYLLQPSVR